MTDADGAVSRSSSTARSTTTASCGAELERSGARFRTRCDTEVLLHALPPLRRGDAVAAERPVRLRDLGRDRARRSSSPATASARSRCTGRARRTGGLRRGVGDQVRSSRRGSSGRGSTCARSTRTWACTTSRRTGRSTRTSTRCRRRTRRSWRDGARTTWRYWAPRYSATTSTSDEAVEHVRDARSSERCGGRRSPTCRSGRSSAAGSTRPRSSP